jgi:hypothetical protein
MAPGPSTDGDELCYPGHPCLPPHEAFASRHLAPRHMHRAEGSRAPRTIVRLAAGATVVEFTRAGDRWRHEVRTGDGRVWQSVEGATATTGDPRWPASPVLTEVSLLEVAGRPAILGLGLAGRSHFSMCVTIQAEIADTLLFETACRMNAEAGWLGSTYRDAVGRVSGLQPILPLPSPPATVRWSYAFGPGGPRHLPPPTVTSPPAGR